MGNQPKPFAFFIIIHIFDRHVIMDLIGKSIFILFFLEITVIAQGEVLAEGDLTKGMVAVFYRSDS